MLKRLANLIERRALVILVIFLLITAYFITFIPNIKFETAVERYLPDNEIGRANERVMNYFGKEEKLHFVYLQSKGSNVLTSTSLREQYKIIESVSKTAGVEETVSIADIINILCKWSLNPLSMSWEYHENNSITTSTDDQISTRVDIALLMLNGTLELPITNVSMLTSRGDVDFLIRLLLSKDFSPGNFDPHGSAPQATLIVIKLNSTLTTSESKRLSSAIRDAVNKIELTTVTAANTGEGFLAYEVDVSSNQSNKILIAAIFVLICVVLWLSFRKFSYVVPLMFTLIAIVIWTFATMMLIGMLFTALVVGVMPLLFGLGIDYPVYISKRYQEELAQGKSINDSMKTSITHVGTAIVLCMITTVVAFASNYTSSIPPIRDFGIMCAVGILFAFILALIMYSSMRFLTDKRRSNKNKKQLISKTTQSSSSKPKRELLDRSIIVASAKARRHRVKVCILVVIVTTLAFWGMINLKGEFSLEDFLPSGWESVSTQKNVRANFEAGTYSQSYILIEGDVATPETLTTLSAIESNLNDDKWVVKVYSNNTTLPMVTNMRTLIEKAVELRPELAAEFNITPNGTPLAQCQKNDIVRLYNYLYYSNETADSLTGESFAEKSPTLLHRNSTGAYDATVIRLYVHPYTSENNREMYNELKNDLGTYSGKITVTGGMVLLITALDSLKDSQITSTLVCILVAAVVLVLVYRKLVLGLITLIPVILSASWIMGTMYLVGIPLNVLTVTVTSLTIGCGVDYSIHINERFREELEVKKLPVEDAIQSTIESTGGSVAIAAITTMVGFSVLMFAPMPIMQQYGFITAITIFYCFISALFIYPIVLTVWAKRIFLKSKKKP